MRRTISGLICGLLLSGAQSSAVQTFNLFPLDPPCSGCAGGIAVSTAQGINPGGDIAGGYRDAVGGQHGYVWRHGQFFTLDVPGSIVGVSGALPTLAKGIGPSGNVVGQFTAPYNPPVSTTAPIDSPLYCPAATSVACIKGFLYSRGQFSVVLFPGHPGAIPQRISPDGSIYGCLHDFDLMGSMFGAIWSRSGDSSLIAGGGELTDSTMGFAMSMNNGARPDGHTIVGLYTDMGGRGHGYVVRDGEFHSWDAPNSISTSIWDVNADGAFVGVYRTSGGAGHGFVQLPDSSAPITIDVPATAPFNANLRATIVFGINPGGSVVGQYVDTAARSRGFLAVPVTE
jgi:hypothetical protein